MAETQSLEMGHDREPAEFANRLREVASEASPALAGPPQGPDSEPTESGTSRGSERGGASEAADEIENGGVLYGFHERETVVADDETKQTIAFTYTPTA